MQMCDIRDIFVNVRGHVLLICEVCEIHVNVRGLSLHICEIHLNVRARAHVANLRDVRNPCKCARANVENVRGLNVRGQVLQMFEILEIHVNVRGLILQMCEVCSGHLNMRGLIFQICEICKIHVHVRRQFCKCARFAKSM